MPSHLHNFKAIYQPSLLTIQYKNLDFAILNCSKSSDQQIDAQLALEWKILLFLKAESKNYLADDSCLKQNLNNNQHISLFAFACGHACSLAYICPKKFNKMCSCAHYLKLVRLQISLPSSKQESPKWQLYFR